MRLSSKPQSLIATFCLQLIFHLGIKCDAVRTKIRNCRQDVCSRSARLLSLGVRVRTALPLRPLSAIRRKISFRRAKLTSVFETVLFPKCKLIIMLGSGSLKCVWKRCKDTGRVCRISS